LSNEDSETVEIWVDVAGRKSLKPKKITLSDIKINIKCFNEKQKELKKSIEDNDITISSGIAGSGKTYLSLLTALHLMKTYPEKYKQLILIKSLTVIPGEEVGILPGDLATKLAPYMWSFTGNLDKIFKSKFITQQLMEDEIIEIKPIAYVRGVTISNSICIIDEIQNITIDTFKSIATRIGSDCKMIFLGDVEQSDLKFKDSACLKTVISKFKDTDVMNVVLFSKSDCVRHPLISKILDILNDVKDIKEKEPIQLNS
jgi:phosphate starvation-inducible PhoH-like protein